MARRARLGITRTARPGRGAAPVVLPAWSVRLPLPGTPSAARHFFLGDPDFRRTGAPWRHVDQMGDTHRLAADGQRLLVLLRKHGTFITEARFIVEPEARAA